VEGLSRAADVWLAAFEVTSVSAQGSPSSYRKGYKMSEKQDFERAWLAKFSSCLDKTVGEEIRKQVMKGSEELASHSGPQEIIDWSKGAMERLDSLVDEEKSREIMTGCACQYPQSDLQEIREKYKATKDMDLARQMLQEQFEAFLKNSLGLSSELIEEIVKRGWGSAGVKKGNTITATKIPKSGYLIEYMQETDPEVKRQYYCHCPRVRNVLKISETISPTYCYCGAGFYKGIWQEILQQPVEVEVLETVLKGDDVCKFAIYLPSDQW
jgi:predicted hydrocarbon binding protein